MIEWYLAQDWSVYAPEIGLVFTTTFLAIYGDNINRKLKIGLRKFPVMARFLGFIGFWVFLLPIGAVLFSRFTVKGLNALPSPWILPLGFLVACALCLLAYREDQI